MSDDQSEQNAAEVGVRQPCGADASHHANNNQRLVEPEVLIPHQLLDVVAGAARFFEMVQTARVDGRSREDVWQASRGRALALTECR